MLRALSDYMRSLMLLTTVLSGMVLRQVMSLCDLPYPTGLERPADFAARHTNLMHQVRSHRLLQSTSSYCCCARAVRHGIA